MSDLERDTDVLEEFAALSDSRLQIRSRHLFLYLGEPRNLTPHAFL